MLAHPFGGQTRPSELPPFFRGCWPTVGGVYVADSNRRGGIVSATKHRRYKIRTEAQDVGVQECGLSPAIFVLSRRHLQHLQRPAPPDLSQNASSVPSLGHANLA